MKLFREAPDNICKLHKIWRGQNKSFEQHLFIELNMTIFDKFPKYNYLEHLGISKNREIIHGDSHNDFETPHDFSLNFWKGLTWVQK